MSKKHDAPWVVMGGKIGESCYCMRCGVGLLLPDPIPVMEFVGAVKKFTDEHSGCREGRAPELMIVTPWDWLASRWTGVSSATIWSVMMDFPSPYKKYDIPYGPDDFHRCHRLFTTFPLWTERLGEVATKFPFWAPYVRAWGELIRLYDQVVESDDDARERLQQHFYDYMKELKTEAELIKKSTI